MVSELGQHTGPDGTSKSLGGQADFEWFVSLRNRAEVILTSGLTYEVEQYRMPKNSALAIFSRNSEKRRFPAEAVRISDEDARDYQEAFSSLRDKGFQSVHCEFGATGFVELSRSAAIESYLSSASLKGIESFTGVHKLHFDIVRSEGLFIARIGSVAVH